jgi:hypothetical protein
MRYPDQYLEDLPSAMDYRIGEAELTARITVDQHSKICLLLEIRQYKGGGGIYSTNVANPILERSIVEHNDVSGGGNGGYGGGGCLVRVSSRNGFLMNDVFIRNNTSFRNGLGLMAASGGSYILNRVIISNNISEEELGRCLSIRIRK